MFTRIAGLALLLLLLLPAHVRAGECDCAAPPGDDTGAPGRWTVTFGYERMDMGTLLRGTTPITPTQAALDGLSGGARMFSVPESMLMERYLLRARYALDERQSLTLTLPQVANQMDMLMAMAPMGMTRSMTMDPVGRFGDASLHYGYDVVDEGDGRLTLGIGLKVPTGDSEVRDAGGRLVHAMMQPGTGSWDAIMTASGRVALDETWALEPALSYQISGTNGLGYRFGNRFGFDLGVRCTVAEPVTLRLDLDGVVTGRDRSDGTLDPVAGGVAYQRPATSLVDNVANTGGSSLYLSPGITWRPTEELSLTVQHRIPIAQSVNGTQLVTDGWTQLQLSGSF